MEYCGLNEHVVGVVMRDMVRRAITEIRNQRFSFEAAHKDNPFKTAEDFVTTADKAAQQIYAKAIRECFRRCGIVAEEGLRLLCHHPLLNIFFTVDPLDGAMAFIRRQSHGIGTMLALVVNGEIVAACVGDVMTQEMYYFRPESDKVHRVSEYNHAETLAIDETRTLRNQTVLLGDDPRAYSSYVQRLTNPTVMVFKNVLVGSGSIGLRAARLWKGEVGAMILRHGDQMPWDIAPVIGISKKLGFDFWRIESHDRTNVRFEYTATPDAQTWDFETLIAHSSRRAEIEQIF